MQPVPGLDPQPQPTPRRRVVIGVHVVERGSWRIAIGLAIVGWGLLLTLSNLGVDPAYSILEHWYFPSVLILLGLVKLAGAEAGSSRIVAGGITALGAWWLASELFGYRFHIWDWWPLVLIFFGIMMIKRSNEASILPPPPRFSSTAYAAPASAEAATAGPASAAGPAPSDVTDGGPVSAVAFWSGVKRRVSAGFKSANCAAFMGGIELDLRPALMVGGRATLEVFVLMGGIEITVPPGWTVANEALVILGGVDDQSAGGTGAQTLVIKGLILMGGVEIKN